MIHYKSISFNMEHVIIFELRAVLKPFKVFFGHTFLNNER